MARLKKAVTAKPKNTGAETSLVPNSRHAYGSRQKSPAAASKAKTARGAKTTQAPKKAPGAATGVSGKKLVERICEYRDRVQKLEEKGRHADYEAFQEVVLMGRLLEKSVGAWLAFIKHQTWQRFKKAKPKLTDREKAVRHALRLYAGPTNSKAASLRWRAVQALDLFGDGDHHLADWLKDNGGYQCAIESHRQLKSADPGRKASPAKRVKAAKVKQEVIPSQRAILTKYDVQIEPEAREILGMPIGSRVIIEAEIVKPKPPLQMRLFKVRRAA